MLQVQGTLEGRWRPTGSPGEGRACQALILREALGARPTGSAPLTPCSGKVTLSGLCSQSQRWGSLSCGSYVLCPLSGRSDAGPGHFRLFSPKGQEMGKKHNVVYLLSGAFWTLGPGAACRGPACFRHLRLRDGDSAPDLGLPVIPPPVGSGGLGGGGRRGGDATGKVLFVCFFCRALVLRPASWRWWHYLLALHPGAALGVYSGLRASGRVLLGSPCVFPTFPNGVSLAGRFTSVNPSGCPQRVHKYLLSTVLGIRSDRSKSLLPWTHSSAWECGARTSAWGGWWLGRLIRVASKGPGGGSDQRTRGRDGRGPHPRLRLGLQGTRWGAGGGVGAEPRGEPHLP